MNSNQLIAILSLFILNQLSAIEPPTKQVLDNFKGSPCEVCRNYVDSFKKGMEKTSRGKFEGGDADWEEQRLGSYFNSEIRFVEIQERICSDLSKGGTDCYAFNEEYEDVVEKWFFNQQESIDLFNYLCVSVVKVCCTDNHYGPDCVQCPDCTTNGKCAGDGDRNGNGTCQCDAGYAGPNCNECSDKYYPAYQDADKIVCTKCHDACANNCTGAGPGACLSCKAGYRKTDNGCVDINECLYENPCSANKFCVNKDGTYICLKCDQSCQECTGDGPDMCVKCAKDYTLNNGVCVDSQTLYRDSYVSLTRYLTYLGMCIATFIIFQRNVYIAGVIGIAVGLYISASEIMLTSKNTNRNQFLQNIIN